MNTTPCKDCAHFEQQHKYRGNKREAVWYGWCKKRSAYPVHEWDQAQPFDVDVRRVAAGSTRSQPLIVPSNGTKSDCTDAIKVSG